VHRGGGGGIAIAVVARKHHAGAAAIADDAVVEPYAGFLGPPHNGLICSIGAWSYTWSLLWPEVKVGRYSQISTDLMIPTPRHPMDLISAHPFVYDRQYSAILATCEDFSEPYSNVVPNPQPPFPIIKNDVWIGRNVVIYPGVTPFIVVSIIVLALITYVPELSLFLTRLHD